MRKAYDVVVIGSGCGGAAAAALMSHLGLKTLLLEKNAYVGGKASTYEKEGFKLDHGHIIMRCEKGPHGDVLRLAGCEDLIPRFSHCTFWPTMYSISGVPVKFVPNFWAQFLTPGFLRQISGYGLTPLEFIQLVSFCLSVIFMPGPLIKALDYVDIHTFLDKYTGSKFTHAFFGPGFIVRLNQRDDPPLGFDQRAGMIQDEALSSPAHVDGDQIDHLRKMGEQRIGALQHHDPLIPAQLPRQRAVAGVDGVDAGRLPLQQAVNKPAHVTA